MSFELSEETQTRIKEKILPKYPFKKSAILPILWAIQEEKGYISRDAMIYAADVVEQPPVHVYSLVTFYTMFTQQPQGKFHLKVCRTITCEVMGCKKMTERIKEKLGIDVGGMTEDGMFSLEEVECLAACEMAPVIQVNEDLYPQMTHTTVDQLLEDFQNGNGKGKPCL